MYEMGSSARLRIALVGYGKMGHILDTLGTRHGHSIVARIDKVSPVELSGLLRSSAADVAIEFTTPASAPENISACVAAGIPVVCGTTGWYDHLADIKTLLVATPGSALFYAPNFSIGVNIALRTASLLAKFRRQFPQYAVSIEETHHTAKLDAPSGTAIALAQPFLAKEEGGTAERGYASWQLVSEGSEATENVLPITAHRMGEVAGIHTLCLDSAQDTLTLTHSAKSREGFARGALAAAEFLVGRSGLFTMEDLL